MNLNEAKEILKKAGLIVEDTDKYEKRAFNPLLQ